MSLTCINVKQGNFWYKVLERKSPEGVSLTSVNVKQGNIRDKILEGMPPKCENLKQGNISHLSEAEGCKFGQSGLLSEAPAQETYVRGGQ